MTGTNALTSDDFRAFFTALHRTGDAAGPEPFPWQVRLVERLLGTDDGWPAALALPTGAGKTACIDIALFVLAAQAGRPPGQRTAPRRIFFVVDRRIVVDAAYERACEIAAVLEAGGEPILDEVARRLRSIGGDGGEAPLACCLLRGGIYRDDRWARSPVQPTVVCSTVDQVGSRLLFRGYGLRTGSMCPVHAGLVGNDSLIILDEAHCANPFRQTLEAVARYRTWNASGDQVPSTPFAHVLVSATPPGEVADVLRADSADAAHPILGARIHAHKPARLKVVSGAHGAGALTRLADAVSERTLAAVTSHTRVAAIVNRVATAHQVYECLKARLNGTADVTLMTGRMREIDRRELVDTRLAVLSSGAPRERGERPQVIVATQCIEVGADLDFEVLVTECASLDALRQRFGRLNRLGRDADASADILIRADQVDPKWTDDPVYGLALSATWSWLQSVAVEGVVDFGSAAMDGLLSERDDAREELLNTLNAPAPDAPRLLPAHVDLLVQTDPMPAADPDISLFLHGQDRGVPDVQVCWRADLPCDLPIDLDSAPWLDALSQCPPTGAECIPVPIHVFRRWLVGEDVSTRVTDVEGSIADTSAETLVGGSRKVFVRWLGPDDSEIIDDGSRIRPGDTIVLPAEMGGWEQFGHIPGAPIDRHADGWRSALASLDCGDRAQHDARDRGVLRLTPSLTKRWPQWASLDELAACGGREPILDDPDRVRDCLRDLAQCLAASDVSADRDVYAPVALRLATDRYLQVEAHPAGGLIVSSSRRLGLAGTTFGTEISGEDDSASATVEVSLATHNDAVRARTETYATLLGITGSAHTALVVAAGTHDIGKLDPRFQALLCAGNHWRAMALPQPLAKSGTMPVSRAERERALELSGYPHGGRHELLSVHLMNHTAGVLDDVDDRDLCLHLVASHHGHCRPLAPPIVDYNASHVSRECGGIHWEGNTAHRLERIGRGVSDRFWRVVRRCGWWRTAWMESLLRLADHRVSAAEQGTGDRRKDRMEMRQEATS